MKVLLFSNDLMPFGNLPTSGGGLRCWQLKNGLEAHGVEVISSMPGFTYLAEKHFDQIPEPERSYLWRWETQEEILHRVKPDAVLFASNWDHFNLKHHGDVPVIIDLHGSRLIETTMWNEPVSTERKLSILSQADCLLTAGRRQRQYFYGWLLQAGRVPEREHFIRYIPISLSPELPEHRHPNLANGWDPQLVSGGGWFPWQNQATAIFRACDAIAKRNLGRIDIFGTPHETQKLSPEERHIREIYAQVQALAAQSDRISVHGYIGRDDLIAIYRGAQVAIECMRYNLERELAFTTRTIEYLWCGLPVLYNNFSEVGEHIAEYDAGWAIDPSDEDAIAAALDEIFTAPEKVIQKSINAQSLVRDRFSWDKTITPLLDFLNNPVKAPLASPALGAVFSRPSFLTPRGLTAQVPLSTERITQRFYLPADDIRTIEVPLFVESTSAMPSGSVSLSLKNLSGKVVSSLNYSLAELGESRICQLQLPLFFGPRGGDALVLQIEPREITAAAVSVRGMRTARFPFIPAAEPFHGTLDVGSKSSAEFLPVEALAISFIPGTLPIQRYLVLAGRAWRMLRSGNIKRLWRAVKFRLPSLTAKLKTLVAH